MIVLLGYLITHKLFAPVVIENNASVKEVEVEVEVDALSERIENALADAETNIAAEAQKAAEAKRTQLEKQIELEVTRAYREEIEAREAQLEEEVSF